VKKIEWSEGARADVRRLDQKTAMRIFEALGRFAETGAGDVKKLKGEDTEYRLRVGDYRVRFTESPAGTLHIHAVRHRREAYR
jgi:mRNA interferase RelE/StbE